MPRRSKPSCAASRRRAGVKAGALIHAVRVALTGKTVSPGLFEVMALLGRDRVRQRVKAALARTAGGPS